MDVEQQSSNDNTGKKAVKELTDAEKTKKKNNIFFRMKKNVSEKAVTSKAGKAALKKILDKDTRTLLETVKRIIAVETGNEQEAEDLEQNAMKIIMKAYNLHTAGIISEKDFAAAEDPLKKALRLILKVYDNLHKLPKEMQKQALEEKFYVIAILFENVQEALKKLLGPHLKEASVLRIDATFKIMANHAFFHNVWQNKSLASDVEFCMNYMRELAISDPNAPQSPAN